MSALASARLPRRINFFSLVPRRTGNDVCMCVLCILKSRIFSRSRASCMGKRKTKFFAEVQPTLIDQVAPTYSTRFHSMSGDIMLEKFYKVVCRPTDANRGGNLNCIRPTLVQQKITTSCKISHLSVVETPPPIFANFFANFEAAVANKNGYPFDGPLNICEVKNW